VGFIRDNDDIVPCAVRLFRVDILVELVDQAEDVTMILLEKLLQLFAGTCPWGLLTG